MENRRKTLLRDHSVPEVTLKAFPKHYSVSAVPETLTVRGPKRPPTNLPERYLPREGTYTTWGVPTLDKGVTTLDGDTCLEWMYLHWMGVPTLPGVPTLAEGKLPWTRGVPTLAGWFLAFTR